MNDLSLLSKYRSALMGAAAIGIVATHSCALVEWPPLIDFMCAMGGVGVYIFMFLSGIGLYYSLKTWDGSLRNGSVNNFYKNRIRRVVIPYAIIAGVWYGVKYLIIEHSIANFLYEWTTLSFWCEHKGAWYVALLIPLYAAYPLWDKWLKQGRRIPKGIIAIMIVLITQIILFNFKFALFEHLSQVLQSLWVFFLGNCMAQSVDEKQSNCVFLILPFILFYLIDKYTIVYTFIPTRPIVYAFKGVILLIVLAFLFDLINRLKLSIITKALGKVGTVSLELYLANIFLIQFVRYFEIDIAFHRWNVKYGDIVLYGIITIGCIIIAVIASYIRQRYDEKYC